MFDVLSLLKIHVGLYMYMCVLYIIHIYIFFFFFGGGGGGCLVGDGYNVGNVHIYM